MKDEFNNFQPVERIDGDRKRGLLLIADHARADIPPQYGTLGLADDQLRRHIAYDIGVRQITINIAERLGVPAVMSTFSRLLIDPNRGADDPTLIMRISDGALIPGNAAIGEEEITLRKATYYQTYHDAVREELHAIESQLDGGSAVVLSIHSFTESWRGIKRPWEIGILWDSDPRLAVPLIKSLAMDESINVGDNEPYDGALLNDCMYRHGTSEGRAHALVEFRQDLISDDRGVDEWAMRLERAIYPLLDDNTLYERKIFASRALERVGLKPELTNN